jgi:methylphosphotriester-DNA--protein-cysteine methyltransferase
MTEQEDIQGPRPKYFGEYTEAEKAEIRARLRASPIFSKDISDERLDGMIKSQTNWMAENPEKFATTVAMVKRVTEDPGTMKSLRHVAEVVGRSGGIS